MKIVNVLNAKKQETTLVQAIMAKEVIIKASDILDVTTIAAIKMAKAAVPWQWLKVWNCPSKEIPRDPRNTKGLIIYERNETSGPDDRVHNTEILDT